MTIQTLFGNNSNNTLRATKTQVDWWFDRWDSWKIYGRGGNDYIIGGEKADYLYGEGGDDTIEGGKGNDVIYGDGYGDFGVDHLYGGDNNDTLYGGAGGDFLYGGNHNDFLDGGLGADYLDGGTGNDYYVAYGSSNGIFEDTIFESSGGGYDTLETNVTVTLAANVEKLVLKWTSFEGATGVGNALNNVIDGWHFNDYLYGKEGIDYLNGGLGNDYLNGGKDVDILNGGQGNDILVGEEGNDSLTGYGGGTNERDTMTGGIGSDSFYLCHGPNLTNISYMDEGFATITDFSRFEGDKVMMAGSQGMYTRQLVDGDAHILRGGNLIAVIEDAASINFSMAQDVTYF